MAPVLMMLRRVRLTFTFKSRVSLLIRRFPILSAPMTELRIRPQHDVNT
jgi:hypothetical protein